MGTLRLVTYNVHSCKGCDGRLRPERILAVIQELSPDVVALQELEMGHSSLAGLDHAAFFAERLQMELFFVAARAKGEGSYGNAILSRLPARLVRTGALPRLYDSSEQRAAQWVRLETRWGPLDVMNTHLGLLGDERLLQAECLLSQDWLLAPELSEHVVLCGDLNASPGSPPYARLCSRLWDAQGAKRWPRATFPSPFPVVRIDHVLTSRSLAVEGVKVPSHVLARLASDHRPLAVDLAPREQGLS